MPKLKGLRIVSKGEAEVEVYPIYYGKGGSELRASHLKVRGKDIVQVAGAVVEKLLARGEVTG